jgi:lysozyme family protein
MNSRFSRFVKIIIENEGGYVNHPADPGGETKYGITKRVFPDLDIKNLTEQQAADIYFKYYYAPLNLDGVVDDNAALQIFDYAVNAGKSRAVRTAQKVCGFDKKGVDGVIGQNTIKKINSIPEFTVKYKIERELFYKSLVSRRSELKVFLNGWIKRVNKTTI